MKPVIILISITQSNAIEHGLLALAAEMLHCGILGKVTGLMALPGLCSECHKQKLLTCT